MKVAVQSPKRLNLSWELASAYQDDHNYIIVQATHKIVRAVLSGLKKQFELQDDIVCIHLTCIWCNNDV